MLMTDWYNFFYFALTTGLNFFDGSQDYISYMYSCFSFSTEIGLQPGINCRDTVKGQELMLLWIMSI